MISFDVNLNIVKPHRFNNLIWVAKNSLSKEFCLQCIEKFESDENRYQGITGDGVRLDIKRSTDLCISSDDNWKDEDAVFFKSLNKETKKYLNEIPDAFGLNAVSDGFKDSGYQIQKTEPGGFYTWHNDFSCTNLDDGPRYITFLWYLNDIHEDGYTEFIDGTKIQPETGKLILFPATWTYSHRGYPPKSETKYICTGWIHTTKIP